MSELTREQFLKDLRDALGHLRDPNYLRQSPLADLLGVANRADTPTALRRTLIDAVKSLRPEDTEPPQSPAWRLYESLFYRYVQYFSQLEVAHQLGISTRQLRREQRAALETLAYQLWEQFDVQSKLADEPEGPADDAARGVNNAAFEDLLWLKDATSGSPTDLERELPAVLALVQPLAAQYGVHLEATVDGTLPHLAANPVALRQTLLSLLGVAIPRASSCGHVHISARSLRREVELRVQCAATASTSSPISESETPSLDMARRLVSLCGGRLTVSAEEKAFSTTLTFPAVGQVPVLAIDDNAGTLRLLQRYTAGTRYHLVGVQDPEEALSLAGELAPQIIVLDVMMPHADGWEILGRLRQHPLTGHIPVVVCTILAEEELALSLGASNFVRKPVTRRAFLAALDRQTAPTAQGLR